MMDNETRTTLLNICSVLSDLTAVCRQINSDNEILLKENYLLSKGVKNMNDRLKTHLARTQIRGFEDSYIRAELDEINKDLFRE